MDGHTPTEDAEEPKSWRAQLGRVLAEVRAEGAADEAAAPPDAGGAGGARSDPAARSLRKETRLLPGGDMPDPASDANLEAEPVGSTSATRGRTRPVTNRALAGHLNSGSLNKRSLTGRALIHPHLRNDPRLRIWITRAVVAFAIMIGFTIGLNWRIGVTAAVVYVAADSILRSKTTSAVPSGVRVTSAQRFTRRRLRVLQPAGYVALHARVIPGTSEVIDHVVVGPAGVFTLDSQRLDRRLPIRAIGGMLYHGRTSLEPRLDHAQHEATQAANLIAAELGLRVRVLPAMVLYGSSVSWVVMKVKGVDVFDGSRIGTYFRRHTKAVGKNRLDESQIAMILSAAARALPPLPDPARRRGRQPGVAGPSADDR